MKIFITIHVVQVIEAKGGFHQPLTIIKTELLCECKQVKKKIEDLS